MSSLVTEFLRFREEGKDAPSAAVAVRLRRLNHAAGDLVREARRHHRSLEEMWEMRDLSARLASGPFDEDVLEAVIRRAEEL
jgi:hypothetical protein